MEIYKKHRPKYLKDIVGQNTTVVLLEVLLKNGFPQSIMLCGNSGCGKTTIARILKSELGCSDRDFTEINAADSRGIDTIRDIKATMGLCPVEGKRKIWLIDEAHKLTGDAQTALLKTLEDTPRHCNFMLATTHPDKLLPTIRTRCTEIRVVPISQDHMGSLLLKVCKKEKKEISQEVVSRIIEVSEGSARKALVVLESIIGLESEEEQLKVILSSEGKRQSIELCRVLLNPRSQWKEVTKILENLEEEPEQLRWMVLGYCASVLLKGGKMADRAYAIINSFESNFFDSKKAGLVAACYRVMANG